MMATILNNAIGRIERTRSYTLGLLAAAPDDEWFRQPAPGLTHIAWQVGHIAVAQYGLTMAATRGAQDSDAGLLTPEQRKLFGRGSTVSADPNNYPSPSELRAMLDRVHHASLAALAAMNEEELQGPPLIPLAFAKTKLDAVQFAPEHEMLHCGEIALLRRLFGHAPLR